jgi:hypothetical protein
MREWKHINLRSDCFFFCHPIFASWLPGSRCGLPAARMGYTLVQNKRLQWVNEKGMNPCTVCYGQSVRSAWRTCSSTLGCTDVSVRNFIKLLNNHQTKRRKSSNSVVVSYHLLHLGTEMLFIPDLIGISSCGSSFYKYIMQPCTHGFRFTGPQMLHWHSGPMLV